jgi:hypothetical protein
MSVTFQSPVIPPTPAEGRILYRDHFKVQLVRYPMVSPEREGIHRMGVVRGLGCP